MESLKSVTQSVTNNPKLKTWQQTAPTAEPILRYNCDRCRDVGTIIIRDGDRQTTEPCDCAAGQDYRYQRMQSLRQQSEVFELYRQFTDFDAWWNLSDHLLNGKHLAIAAAEMFIDRCADGFALSEISESYATKTIRKHSLILRGDYGVGKTALMVTIANQLMDRTIPVMFISVSELFRRITDTFSSNKSKEDVLKPLLSANVLCLDEWKMLKPPDFFIDTIQDIIRHRYNRRLPFVITVNSYPSEMTQTWGRIATDAAFQVAHVITMSGMPLRDIGANRQDLDQLEAF